MNKPLASGQRMLAFTLSLLAVPLALAQTAAPIPQPAASQPSPAPTAFDVASIHPHQGLLYSIADFSSSGPRVRLVAFDLHQLIMEAYNLRNFQVSFPGIDEQVNTYYDIAAIAPEGATPTRDDFRRMLQTLLAERYQLKAHFTKKDTPVYALVIAKGPKLAPATDDKDQLVGVNDRNQFLRTSKITMNDLAIAINSIFAPDRPVIDHTGLTGTYKLRIEATPEWRMNRDPQPGDLSVFTAVQEQLGLKLEPSTAPLDILVIDSAQPPTPN